MSADKITSVRQRLDALRTQKVRNDALLESATQARDQALEDLRTQFGLDNIADARAMLAELEDNYQQRLTEITKILDEIEK